MLRFCQLLLRPYRNRCSSLHDRNITKTWCKILQPVIELLVGIPSVVYGFIGLQVVVPFVRSIFGGTGFGILSGVFVLFVMILPTVTFMTVDSLRAVPRHYREASLAMGATRWQTIWRVILNAAACRFLRPLSLVWRVPLVKPWRFRWWLVTLRLSRLP